MDKENTSDTQRNARLQEMLPEQLIKDLKAIRPGAGSWESCPIEEKIERLRRSLQDLRWMLHHLRQRTRGYEAHKHDALGEVMVPMREKYAEGESASSRDLLA